MAEIRAIVWDIGGVLLTNGWDHRERAAVLEHFGLDREAYEARHEAANDAWERGLMTAGQFLARTVFFEPRAFTPAEFLTQMKAQSQLLPNGAMNLVARLRAAGKVQLAVLSNEARELNAHRIATFALADSLHTFLSSCYVGLRKPERKMFQLALDVLQCEGRELAFVDDREENCAAAESVGIHAIRYQDEAQCSSHLEQLGVIAKAQMA